MAVLGSGDLGRFIKTLRSDPPAWAAQMSEHPNKFQTLALFQALDDWFEVNRSGMKAAMDASGVVVSNGLAKKYGKAWMRWKLEGE